MGTDGTYAGTNLVYDINSGTEGSYLMVLKVAECLSVQIYISQPMIRL